MLKATDSDFNFPFPFGAKKHICKNVHAMVKYRKRIRRAAYTVTVFLCREFSCKFTSEACSTYRVFFPVTKVPHLNAHKGRKRHHWSSGYTHTPSPGQLAGSCLGVLSTLSLWVNIMFNKLITYLAWCLTYRKYLKYPHLNSL